MDSDVLYAVLMSFGWLFLVGWLALLLIACLLAFRSEPDGRNSSGTSFASGMHKAVGPRGRWNMQPRG
jgi:hypothetical protein